MRLQVAGYIPQSKRVAASSTRGSVLERAPFDDYKPAGRCEDGAQRSHEVLAPRRLDRLEDVAPDTHACRLDAQGCRLDAQGCRLGAQGCRLDGLEGDAHEDEVGLCPVRQRGRGARLHTHGVHVGGGAAARVEGAEGVGTHFEREDEARRQQRCELEREEACARESVSRFVRTYYSRLVLGSCLLACLLGHLCRRRRQRRQRRQRGRVRCRGPPPPWLAGGRACAHPTRG